MKTLTFAALLLLAISGWARASETAPPSEAPAGAADVEDAAEGIAPQQPAAGEGVEPATGVEAAAEDDADWVEAGENAGAPDESVRVAEADAAAGPTAGGQTSPGDSLMMDVGEVLDELLWPEPYLYQSAGTRDPFAPLVGKEGSANEGPLAIGDMIVVGVLWGEPDRFALVETRGGNNLVMRVGDAVQDGRVIEVLPDGLRISHTLYGVTRVITLAVRSGLEGKDER